MKSLKNTGQIVGVLFLTLMVAYSIGAFILIDPVLNSPDYLMAVSENSSKVITGVLLELINGIAYIGIAVLVYPIFKRFNESIALAYLGFRILEFAMQIISDLSPLMLTTISLDNLGAGALEASSVQALGTFLIAQRFWANQMVFITYCLGAFLFYYVSHKTRLIPRLLTVWGLIGVPLVLLNVLMDIFGLEQVIFLGLVMGLNELVLGIWLMVKGFNSTPVFTAQGGIRQK